MSVTTLSPAHEATLAEFVADLATADTWDEAAIRYSSLVAVYLGADPTTDELQLLTAATVAYRERRRIIAARNGLRSHADG